MSFKFGAAHLNCLCSDLALNLIITMQSTITNCNINTYTTSKFSNALSQDTTTHQQHTTYTNQHHQQSPSSWSDQQLLYLINHILHSAQHTQALNCNYVHLFICLGYLQAHKFIVSRTNKNHSYSFQLFLATIKKINWLRHQYGVQLQQGMFEEVSSECLNYYRKSRGQDYFMGRLNEFLQAQKAVMVSFMPLYFEYFKFVLGYKEIFQFPPKLQDIDLHLQAIKTKVAKRYSNTVVI